MHRANRKDGGRVGGGDGVMWCSVGKEKNDITNSTKKLFKGQQTPIPATQIKIEREIESE